MQRHDVASTLMRRFILLQMVKSLYIRNFIASGEITVYPKFYCKRWNHCISEINKTDFFTQWKDTIFSLVKNNAVMLLSLFVTDYLGFRHCFPNRCRSHFVFCFFLNYQVLVCIFLVRCKEHLVIFWFAETFCFCLSSASPVTVVIAFFLSTETHAKRLLTIWTRSVWTTHKRSFAVLANQIIVSERFQAFRILANQISVRKTLSWNGNPVWLQTFYRLHLQSIKTPRTQVT